ncbi:hypothetical protein N0V90_007257 [Kalmusia sp. IMI 367209]|nr:hypothetical protein N0V90_007257 [Kalmusia sp. IMI 367209]
MASASTDGIALQNIAQTSPGDPEHDLRLAISVKGGSEVNGEYFQWYLGFLFNEFQQLPSDLRNAIVPATSRPPFTQFCALLASVAKYLREESSVTLEDLYEGLSRLNPKSDDDSTGDEGANVEPNDEDRMLVFQLIFIGIGFLTHIYKPAYEPSCGKLQIASLGGPLRASRDRAWRLSEIPIQHESTLTDLLLQLGNFGTLRTNGPLPRPHREPSLLAFSEQDALRATHLSYYSITKLADITIDWVDCVAEHLEFDRRLRVLKLYRFPSFCALLCSSDPEKTFLCRFMNDYCADVRVSGNSAGPNPAADPVFSGLYLREIIATYRLFFGQDKPSRKALQQDLKRGTDKERERVRFDPLLLRLCTKDWTDECVFEHLDIPDVRTVYSATIDFPFLMHKMITLQEYIITQQPTGWSSLWRDRRDPARFWGLFAVIAFGVASILLSLVQIALSGAQVASIDFSSTSRNATT